MARCAQVDPVLFTPDREPFEGSWPGIKEGAKPYLEGRAPRLHWRFAELSDTTKGALTAIRICNRCEVRDICLEKALVESRNHPMGEDIGVRGGLLGFERDAIRAQRAKAVAGPDLAPKD
jgi:hypothetical protein